MSKRHAGSTPDEKAPKRRKLSADKVLVEAARNGDTTAVRVGLEKLSPDTNSKKVSFDAAHEACRGNHDECLALLLPYVETTQMGFGMLLSECVHADHTACTEVLLQHWKSVCSNVAFVPHGQEDIYGQDCPAMWADPAVCQVLIDAGADVETKDDMGRSPLLKASVSGKFAVVKMLVEAGADVRVIDNDGESCLTLATSYDEHTETVRYLVGLKDVDVNHSCDGGSTALHWVCQENYPEVVQALIDAGADIEAKDDREGCSPLLWACRPVVGQFAVVKVLVKAGADVCVTSRKGDTCLTLAANGDTETVRTLLCMPEVDVSQSNDRGNTPLHCAVFKKRSAVVDVLIDAGADIEARNNLGRTPLLVACENGDVAKVKMLVKAGAEARVTDNGGSTCLIIAAYYGHTETVRYLMGLPGVDVHHAANGGETALHVASRRHGHHVAQILLEHYTNTSEVTAVVIQSSASLNE